MSRIKGSSVAPQLWISEFVIPATVENYVLKGFSFYLDFQF